MLLLSATAMVSMPLPPLLSPATAAVSLPRPLSCPASVAGPYSASVAGPAGYTPKQDVIEPKVTRVEPTRANKSEDVQPSTIKAVVQPVVDPLPAHLAVIWVHSLATGID